MSAQAAVHVVVEVTTATREEAEGLARRAVEQRLAGSGQVGALRTWYRWKGQVCEADEYRVSLFTRRDRFESLAALVRAHHGYELPQIVAVPLCDGTPEFLRWIDQCVAAD